jgi:hypothetical protein
MPRRLVAVLAIVLASPVLSLYAADMSGFWLGSAATGGRRNLVQDVSFQFIQKGTTLTGKLYVDYGSTPILKGTVEGDRITFQVVAREQAGNEINQSVFRFTGTWKDGEIEMTRDREEVRTAANSGGAFARPGSTTFRLKRLP